MFERIPPEEVVASLSTTDCEVLTDREVVGVMTSTAAVAAWAESMVLSAVARLRVLRQEEYREVVAGAASGRARGDLPVDEAEVDRFCASEVAVALRISQRAALDRVRLADVLVERLPGTLAGLGSGRLSLGHARAVADCVEVLAPDVALRVDGELVLAASSRTPPQLAADARRAAGAIEPGYAAARCRQARAARRAGTWALPDGVSALQVTGPSETVAGAWARIDEIARRMQGEARMQDEARRQDEAGPHGGARMQGEVPALDQLRADAVLGLLAGTPDLLRQASRSVAVHVDVVVPLSTAVGTGCEPAELSGVGPLPAELAQGLLSVADRVRVVDLDIAYDGRHASEGPDATGRATADRGPYRPSSRLVELVRARDVTCRFPGCRRTARACDVDHTVPYPHGPTASCNLACLCRSHHRVKHRAGWQVRQLGGGRLRWTSPTGHVTVTDPPAWCRTVDRRPEVVQRT